MSQKRSSQPSQEYVVGYCFDTFFEHVVLIEKLKPEWQHLKLNGVGGKVERGEKPLDAMRREFQEEAGLYISNWQHIRTERFRAEQEASRGEPKGAVVHHFATQCPYHYWGRIRTMTAEQIVKVPLPFHPRTLRRVIYNLPYLVPMAEILLQQPPQNCPAP